ncbi:MAG: fibrobacter succinogenes major paralogous domain-containing protein [Bacteroidia bacterium]|nr:fibrobacter succinogenes major paralogous domain-containing protein [Bacteroidia bacterium]
MKELVLTTGLTIVIVLSALAQAPNGFKYQAVIRNEQGSVIVAQNVSIRISILKDSISNPCIYSETHNVTTNAFGLVNLEIGSGTVQTGVFALINWASGTYFAKIELDETGGSSYSEMGTSQFLSVPYALFANNVRLNKNNEDFELYITDAGNLIAINIINDPLGEPCSGAVTVTDYDGNVYNTVQIGDQCWMKENLKTTHYADGTLLIDGTGVGGIYGDDSTKYWFVYKDSIELKDTYGLLYTWAAVMNEALSSNTNPSGVQGVCPTGWHVPGDVEWEQLVQYLGSNIAGGRLKEEGTLHWNSPNSDATNLSGFTALPGGYRLYSDGTFSDSGNYGYWWSATEYSSTNAWIRNLDYSNATVYRGGSAKEYGFSVRCLKD